MQTCDRCGKTVVGTIMSFFNTDEICMRCREKERTHPEYKRARAVELAEVKRGNYNFAGIGLPADLGR